MTAEKKIKRIRKITPAGSAKWAHVQTPKAPYVNDQGQVQGGPKYMIDLVFDPKNPAWLAWARDLNARIAAIPTVKDHKTEQESRRNVTIKKEFDKDDQPTGNYYVTFKTSDKFKPGLFDAARNPLPEGTLIGNGSTVKVAYTENEYSNLAAGTGINLYLEGVQVLKLVAFAGRTASDYGFAEEEGETIGGNSDDNAPF